MSPSPLCKGVFGPASARSLSPAAPSRSHPPPIRRAAHPTSAFCSCGTRAQRRAFRCRKMKRVVYQMAFTGPSFAVKTSLHCLFSRVSKHLSASGKRRGILSSGAFRLLRSKPHGNSGRQPDDAIDICCNASGECIK